MKRKLGIKSKRAQGTLEYVIILTAIIAAVVLASVYMGNKVFVQGGGSSLLGRAGTVITNAAADMNYESPR